MEFHEVANIFPMMTDAEFKELVIDIKENGLIMPIETYQGKIIDGRNRYKACLESAIKPEFNEWNGKGDLVKHVVSLNMKRRHLNESQRGMVAARVANMKKGGTGSNQYSKKANPQICGVSHEEASQLLNVSTRTTESASRVLEHGTPELVQAVEQGEVKVSTAATLTKLPQAQQKEILDQGKELI